MARTPGERLEILRRSYEALNRRDAEGVVRWADPEIEFVSILAQVEGGAGIFRGHDGLREYMAMADEMFVAARWEIVEAAELDDGRVLASIRFEGTARQSGVDVSRELGMILTFSDAGDVVRMAAHATPAEAREAARGVPPSG